MFQFLVGHLTGIPRSEQKGDQVGDVAAPVPIHGSSGASFSDLLDQELALYEQESAKDQTPNPVEDADQTDLASPDISDAISAEDRAIVRQPSSGLSLAYPDNADADEIAPRDSPGALIESQTQRNDTAEIITPTPQRTNDARYAPSITGVDTVDDAGTSVQMSGSGRGLQSFAYPHPTDAPQPAATLGKTAQGNIAIPDQPQSDAPNQLETVPPRAAKVGIALDNVSAPYPDPEPVRTLQTGSSLEIGPRSVASPVPGDTPLPSRNTARPQAPRRDLSGPNGFSFRDGTEPDFATQAKARDLSDLRVDPAPARAEAKRFVAMSQPIPAEPFPGGIGNVSDFNDLRDFDTLSTDDIRVLPDMASPLRRATGFSFSRVDLAHHVTAQVTEGLLRTNARQIELQLDPVELGRVRINLQTLDGSVVVHIAADRGETLDLLRRHMDILAQDLRDIGYKTSQFAFSDGRSGKPNQDRVKASQSGFQPDAPDPGDISSPAQQDHRVLRLNNGIDIRL